METLIAEESADVQGTAGSSRVDLKSRAGRWWDCWAERRRQDDQLLHHRGLVTPETGRVLVDETDITRLPMYLRARNFASAIFRRNRRSSASYGRENILAVLERSRWAIRERKTRAERLINQLNLGTSARRGAMRFRRRTEKGYDCARVVHSAHFHSAGRALQRH